MVKYDKELSEKVKNNIQILIESGHLNEAKDLIEQYEIIEPNDVEIFSMEAVLYIIQNKMEEAENILYKAFKINKFNFDVLYNLAYLYELKSEVELALEFYKKALTNCDNENMIGEIKNKINLIRSNIEICNAKEYENIRNPIKGYSTVKIIDYMYTMLDKRKFSVVINSFLYYLRYNDTSIGEMYYFVACAYNAMKDFKNAIKFHNIAIRVEPYISNIIDEKNTTISYKFQEENISCIGCGESHFEVVNVLNQSISETNKGIINPIRTWVKCKKCGLIYVNPITVENTMNDFYSRIATEKFGGIYGNIKDKQDFLIAMSNLRLKNILKITNKKLLLDIGTGIGFFVKAALEKGFDAYGLELTEEDCNYAKKYFGLDLIRRNFYSFSDDEQYDVVTMFEVIEHLRTPLKDLKRINKLVKENGIFVIATPILDSEYGIKTKEKNVFWNTVTHLSYFTTKVLSRYLNEAGFEIIFILDSLEGMGRKEFYCRKVKKL